MRSTITLTQENILLVAAALNKTLQNQTICHYNFKEIIDIAKLNSKQASTYKAYSRAAVALTCDHTGLSLFFKKFLAKDFLEAKDVVARIGDTITFDDDKIICIHNPKNADSAYQMTAFGLANNVA